MVQSAFLAWQNRAKADSQASSALTLILHESLRRRERHDRISVETQRGLRVGEFRGKESRSVH